MVHQKHTRYNKIPHQPKTLPSKTLSRTRCHQTKHISHLCTPNQHFSALHTSDECMHRNILPASDLAKGWIIDSGASAHMTPLKQDCKNVQPTKRTIFLADGSTVLCHRMATIHIPIKQHKRTVGTLKLDDVLIVPNLDRRLFSVNSFLPKGNNWVHFTQQSIELGIKGGPKLSVPIIFLQTNAMLVNVSKQTKSSPVTDTFNRKLQISTDTLRSRLHRSHGTLATIKPTISGMMLKCPNAPISSAHHAKSYQSHLLPGENIAPLMK